MSSIWFFTQFSFSFFRSISFENITFDQKKTQNCFTFSKHVSAISNSNMWKTVGIRTYQLMRKNEYQPKFHNFSQTDLFGDVDKEEHVFSTIETFIYDLHNDAGIIDVDAARFYFLINKYTVVFDMNQEHNGKNPELLS